jgi:conjugative transposon TraN protein
MRKIFIALCTMVSVITGNAQNTPIGENIELAGENPEELKVIYVNKDVSTHFIAMEDIKYVDISVNDIVGDIPTGNSLRIKPKKEGASGVITIVTERFFVQYMLVYSSDLAKKHNSLFNIPYADLRSYMNPEVNLQKAQMYDYAHRMFISKKNKFYDVSSKKSNLMKIGLNNIYTLDKYFFIDISMINKKQKIRYDIDQIRFKIEVKKKTKATNFQSIEILPLMQVNKNLVFKKNYRNFFVFEKFTFPDEKVLTIEISEKQISGRTITLRIDYADILHADAFTE